MEPLEGSQKLQVFVGSEVGNPVVLLEEVAEFAEVEEVAEVEAEVVFVEEHKCYLELNLYSK